MSACDKVTDAQLAGAASAIRKWTAALSAAGLPPEQYVEFHELAACTDLMQWFPAPLHDDEGAGKNSRDPT